MASIFSRIIAGEIPGRFVWSDDRCVVMVDIRPLARGHVLVIPRDEIDEWSDLPVGLAGHLMQVAHAVSRAQREVFPCARVGLIIAGFEVPHAHIHVVPMDSMSNLDFGNADPAARPDDLDQVTVELRRALVEQGHGAVVPR